VSTSVKLTDRISRIVASPALAVAAEAEKFRQSGADVVDFSIGEPDFPTPDHIKQAAIEAIQSNKTKYTAAAGIAPLRQAIVKWHAAQFGTAYEPAECVATTGGKHALFHAICCLIAAGDEVLIPAPYWVSFPDMVKYAGGTPVVIETRAAENFALTAAQVEAAITGRTRLLIVNSPNNPTGAVIPRAEYERILDVCRRRNVLLMADECYSHFVYSGAPFSIAGADGAKPQVIVAGSCSKTFSMTGWRLGYALAPKPLAEAIAKLQSQSVSNPTSISQYAALGALTGPMDTVKTMLEEYRRRRDRILAGLRALPGVTCTEPQGAFYVFPNCEARLADRGAGNTTELARLLLEREHLAVVPGEAFGAPGHLRFSYATSMDRIEEGLRRLARFFAANVERRAGSAS
jgi:aspartate aminotransferase